MQLSNNSDTGPPFVSTSISSVNESHMGESLEQESEVSSPTEEIQKILKDDWPNPELSAIFSTLVESKWRSLLESELKKDYLKKICHFLEQQYSTVF